MCPECLRYCVCRQGASLPKKKISNTEWWWWWWWCTKGSVTHWPAGPSPGSQLLVHLPPSLPFSQFPSTVWLHGELSELPESRHCPLRRPGSSLIAAGHVLLRPRKPDSFSNIQLFCIHPWAPYFFDAITPTPWMSSWFLAKHLTFLLPVFSWFFTRQLQPYQDFNDIPIWNRKVITTWFPTPWNFIWNLWEEPNVPSDKQEFKKSDFMCRLTS